MATLNTSSKTASCSGPRYRVTAYLSATYTTSTDATKMTISGTVYVKGSTTQTGYAAVAMSYKTGSASTVPTISATNGTVTRSFTNQSVSVASGSGSKSVGTFTITVPKKTAAQTITLTLSGGCTAQTMNSSAYGDVSGTASISLPALESYTVSYNANGGTNPPANQTKYYNTALTLTTAKPTKDGYTFKGWATSTANAAAGTVNYASGASYTGNAALTLYAVWELAYTKPIITNVKVERCTSSGALDDEGQYARVSLDWSVYRSSAARYYGGATYPYSSNQPSTFTVAVGTQSKSVSTTAASGTQVVVVGNGTFSTESQYSVTITITDSQTIYSDKTTTATAILATSYFPMDFNEAADAVGFFMPAPDNEQGMYVGRDLNVNGNLVVSGYARIGLATTDDLYVAINNLGWTSDVIV